MIFLIFDFNILICDNLVSTFYYLQFNLLKKAYMVAVFIALFAQFCVTSADIYVKKKTHLFHIELIKKWVPRYAITRYMGLCLRLYALFLLPVASAATLFSASAITVSSAVALKSGEILSKREKIAIILIMIAVVIRNVE